MSRPVTLKDRESIMLTMSRSDKKLLQRLAKDRSTSASGLVRQWAHEHKTNGRKIKEAA